MKRTSESVAESIFEPNNATQTLDPGSVSFFQRFEQQTRATDGGVTEQDYWRVHPSTYAADLTRACFHVMQVRVPVLIAPYFLGDRLEEGLRSAMGAGTMRFNARVRGKILSYSRVRMEGGERQTLAECTPELRGHVAVPVEASCLVFAPAPGAEVLVDISRVALKGTVLGHVLALATVRFDAEALLGRFMRVSGNRWRYGPEGQYSLEARDVVSCRVTKVGQEDESGLIMVCEVEPGDCMVVLSQGGRRVVLAPLPAQAAPLAAAATLSPAAAPNKRHSTKKAKLVA